MSKKPFISIVIPTRDRYETLSFTIETILQQDFEDYEIIISDNNSSVETKQIIDYIDSSKIKYIRSNIDLSLCDSWEQAVSNARGEYIMGMADNDGIIMGALSFLVSLIKLHNTPLLINFVKNGYHWPCLEETIKNTLFLHTNPSIHLVNGISLIQEVIDNNKTFYKLPMLYNSIVHYSLIEKMKKKTGRIFNSVTADVYSGFCLAYLTKNYISISQPITIAGNSSKSLGVNYTRNNGKIIQRESKSRKKSSIQLDSITPCVISHSAHIADAFLQSKRNLSMKNFIFDRKKMIEETISDLTVFTKENLQESIKIILRSCEDDKILLKYTKNHLSNNPPKISIPTKNKIIVGFNKNKLILNGDNFACNNILDVSKLMSNFYDYSLNTINYIEVIEKFDNLKKNSKIAIWGNGEYGKILQEKLSELRSDVKIICIIDSFKEDSSSAPKVVTPDNISQDIDYVVIASSYVVDISKIIYKLKIFDNITILRFNK